ncbi:uncharacterized protein AC631_06012, partial [Debaryomyces fabryi]
MELDDLLQKPSPHGVPMTMVIARGPAPKLTWRKDWNKGVLRLWAYCQQASASVIGTVATGMGMPDGSEA